MKWMIPLNEWYLSFYPRMIPLNKWNEWYLSLSPSSHKGIHLKVIDYLTNFKGTWLFD